MTRTKIAIKALTPSDLSLFKAHAGLSQKRAINLNSTVFIEKFYPGLQGSYDQVIFPLFIIGPGARGSHELTRMAMRSPGTKNWHIKGEPIHDPVEEPGRFDALAENDFALMAFEGHGRPRAVTLILISADEDAELHAAIAARLEISAKHTMVAVPEAVVAHLRANTLGAYTDNAHPLDALISRDTVEDVLFGTGTYTEGSPSSRPVVVSPEDFRRQLLAADETCQQGEEFFGSWLIATGHKDDGFNWISQTHARSAYHYEVYEAKWIKDVPHVLINVKTTRASFERPIHMSIYELHFAAKTENYRIARLYNVDGNTPKLRILTGVRAVATKILGALNALPDRIAADSIQLAPSVFETELTTNLH